MPSSRLDASAHDTPQRRPTLPERRIDSRELLGIQGQLIIEHQGKTYQLRETRNGKLILTS
ncbi:hemin uptake protein HemP [Billgrantia gudaonensis]|uniref:Hemin uptake protein HemP n=1 Tax=Billgrantia gudaonensis TaxID=376427 RepID=A0A1G9ATN4_9GAMM|nr:hemin uptake protein HemP [Halomonas gudaonensis]SDK29980.1 Hemin uptake protein HemP [Halomonas gudaonensis]